MIFSFGKKKNNLDPNDPSGKKRSIDAFGADLNDSSVLGRDDMGKLGGGKTSSKQRYDDGTNFQNTFSSTIPS
ncbi:MAG TPA: hypothetical protein PK971_11185 [Saprospiraceae bacterium]|nr:hypothetical protein [Saprospiraceae bacterium]HND88885.1 hypothetical protein [Saprospiraceae bacterium]